MAPQTRRSEAGQTNIEYGLVIIILAIALIVLLTFMAGSVTDFYANAAELVREAFTKSSTPSPQ
jgi:Flp pilus assembly pilin Flp